jgi:alpha-ketoglutarate-dependent taurine dioxygenase
MAADHTSELVVEPLPAPLGAIVRGMTFSDQTDPSTVTEVEQAIGQYQVLVFRGHQPPTDAQLAEFTGHFGVRNPKTTDKLDFTKEGYPEIVTLSNIIENGKRIGAGTDGGFGYLDWHTDLAHSRQNARFGFLDAVEVPGEAGNTLFANGYAALEALRPAERERLAGLEVYHVADGGEYPKPGKATAPGELTPIRRPVIVTNPTTGRRALFLSQLRGASQYRAVDQSRADEVEALTAHLTSPRFVYEHHWKVGDLVMWDQIGLLHARRQFDPSLRRILRQISVKVADPEDALWNATGASASR